MRGGRGGSERRDVFEKRRDSTGGAAERIGEEFVAVSERRVGVDDGEREDAGERRDISGRDGDGEDHSGGVVGVEE